MKKHSGAIFWRLVALVLCVGACWYATVYFSGGFEQPALVGLVRPSGQLDYVDVDALRATVESAGYRYAQSDADQTVLAGIDQMLDEGAEVLVICNNGNLYDNGFLARAKKNDTTLLFVGETPGQAILDSYDKAWYLTNNSLHGAQLLGDRLAEIYRSGQIPDANSNLLLDFVAAVPSDYPASTEAIVEIVKECEHYGVYSHYLSMVRATTDDFAAQCALEWGDYRLLTPELAEELNAEASAEAAGEATAVTDAADQPEVILCTGSTAAEAAAAAAQNLGWRDGAAYPTLIGALLENRAAAEELTASGAVDFAAYYDTEAVSELLLQLVNNAAGQRFVAQGCTVQPDAQKTFTVGYQILE